MKKNIICYDAESNIHQIENNSYKLIGPNLPEKNFDTYSRQQLEKDSELLSSTNFTHLCVLRRLDAYCLAIQYRLAFTGRDTLTCGSIAWYSAPMCVRSMPRSATASGTILPTLVSRLRPLIYLKSGPNWCESLAKANLPLCVMSTTEAKIAVYGCLPLL